MNGSVRAMSLESAIGQLFMVGFSGTTAPPKVFDLIQSRQVGGIILFTRNIRSPRQAFTLTGTLQAAARAAGHPHPLLIAIDQENGIVRRTGASTTMFPGNMALGAIGDNAVAEQIARATGEELLALGITMNLAPDIDIANNPANPVIGVRSFGADPELVARLGAAALRGYRAAGVVATLKHFPGHGDTATDSHRALPVVPFDHQRLEAIELVPFRRGIAEGAEVVMTAHVALPAVTRSATTPATLAPEVLRGLLRERLGFEGVILTDCLEMNAISKTVGIARGAVQALQAGADMVLISHRADRQHAGISAVHAAVADGEIAPEAIYAAAERVMRLKRRLPSWADLPGDSGLTGYATPAHQRLADETYARSMTVVRDEAGLLPLAVGVGGRVLVVAQDGAEVSQAAERGFAPDVFVAALRGQLDATIPLEVTAFIVPVKPTADDLRALQQRASEVDTVILLTRNAHMEGRIVHSRAIAAALLAVQRQVIGIAICNPYDASALPDIPTWLATYDYMPPALEAAARVIAGTASADGKLPVILTS
jgi:beta-N-acetylhexosaminidase